MAGEIDDECYDPEKYRKEWNQRLKGQTLRGKRERLDKGMVLLYCRLLAIPYSLLIAARIPFIIIAGVGGQPGT